MNTMKFESEGKYLVTLENGTEYHEVPCLGAYEDEREALRDIFGGRTGNGDIIEGLFLDKAASTGVVFYYEGDTDRSRYIFIKEGGIFEPVYYMK